METNKVIYLEFENLAIKERANKPVVSVQKKGWTSIPKKVRKTISLTVIAIFIGVIQIIGGMKIVNMASNYGEKKVANQLATYEKVTMVVEKGQSAWELQEKLTPNADIREMLYLAEKENGKNLGVVREGEVITLFKK